MWQIPQTASPAEMQWGAENNFGGQEGVSEEANLNFLSGCNLGNSLWMESTQSYQRCQDSKRF